MKTISFLVLFTFISLQSFPQSLEGEWKGSYVLEAEMPFFDVTRPISLYFVLNKDSSYNIYSYSKGKDLAGNDTIVVCKVLYRKISENSFYLEETQVLKPKNATASCFQKMYLTIRRNKRSTVLEGTWKSGNDCNNSGKIKFEKKG